MPPFMRRRPLMRAAVVGGGAYAIGKHSARKEDQTNQGIEDAQQQAQQAQQMAAQAAAAPPAAAPASTGISEEDISKLKQLADLHASGVLTDAEFEQEKKEILGA
jgi:Short C-terminal domain